MHVTMDMEHRFELAIGLNKLEMAYKIAETLDHDHKWKSIGELALASWNVSQIAYLFMSFLPQVDIALRLVWSCGGEYEKSARLG